MEVNRKLQSIDINEKVRKFTWRIDNFSNIKDKCLNSETFIVEGYKWRILMYPKGDHTADHMSIFLQVADPATLSDRRSPCFQFGFAVINQFDRRTSITQATTYEFKTNGVNWGFSSFLPLKEFHNPNCGFLVNDACLVEAYFSTDRTKALISHELIVKSGSDIQKIDEAEEAKERIKEDMETFFTNLESKLSSLESERILDSKKEAKEALTNLDNVLDMSPVTFYYLVNFSSFRMAFKILSCLECSSTIITIEEKNDLMAIDERLKELACRAAKAEQDKNLLTTKRSVKQPVICNSDCSLIIFKQLEQKLGVLREQVEEAQNIQNMLGEQMEIFKSSKKMKMDLETLEKERVEYDDNVKVVEDEEKNIKIEWKKIKEFVSSIIRKI